MKIKKKKKKIENIYVNVYARARARLFRSAHSLRANSTLCNIFGISFIPGYFVRQSLLHFIRFWFVIAGNFILSSTQTGRHSLWASVCEQRMYHTRAKINNLRKRWKYFCRRSTCQFFLCVYFIAIFFLLMLYFHKCFDLYSRRAVSHQMESKFLASFCVDTYCTFKLRYEIIPLLDRFHIVLRWILHEKFKERNGRTEKETNKKKRYFWMS